MKLDAASGHIQKRGLDYDQPTGERSMGRAVQAFNAITGQSLREDEGWLLLGLVKDVRAYGTKKFHQDSFEDGIAYRALAGEARSAMKTELPKVCYGD